LLPVKPQAWNPGPANPRMWKQGVKLEPVRTSRLRDRKSCAQGHPALAPAVGQNLPHLMALRS
jgi:hypothetical protein